MTLSRGILRREPSTGGIALWPWGLFISFDACLTGWQVAGWSCLSGSSVGAGSALWWATTGLPLLAAPAQQAGPGGDVQYPPLVSVLARRPEPLLTSPGGVLVGTGGPARSFEPAARDPAPHTGWNRGPGLPAED